MSLYVLKVFLESFASNFLSENCPYIPKFVLENHLNCPGISWNCPRIAFKKVLDTLVYITWEKLLGLLEETQDIFSTAAHRQVSNYLQLESSQGPSPKCQ